MQENRSFDSYFGTFPGADGIPRGVCVPDPRGGCVRPYHDHHDKNFGGPHARLNAVRDIDQGAMDGFVGSAVRGTLGCRDRNDPYCVRSGDGIEVMGYHDYREIPNYWTYARDFVLQDHMFEPNASWSLPAHLFLVSEWSAKCSVANVPSSCKSAPNRPDEPPDFKGDLKRHDSQLRVDRPHVPAPQGRRELALLRHEGQGARLCRRLRGDVRPAEAERADAGIWNPLPYFTTVRQDKQLGDIAPLRSFFKAARDREAPVGRVDRAERPRERASAEPRLRGPGLRDAARQRGDAEPRLEVDGDLPRVGRLGRLLRPRRPAEGRRRRVRTPRSRRS